MRSRSISFFVCKVLILWCLGKYLHGNWVSTEMSMLKLDKTMDTVTD